MTHPAGPHRAVPVDVTLARVRPLLPLLGITRVGVLTGLDVVGIPVAAAYRPNSRSIAVHQGKGPTPAAAKISAIMEALECWHAEAADLPLRFGAAEEVARHGAVVAAERLPLTGAGDPRTARMLWASGRDIAAGRTVLVPYEMVSADLTQPAPPGFGLFRQTTNGLGSGNAPIEAVLHGLYELVERDAAAVWHADSPGRQAAGGVDPATVDGPASRWLLERFAAAGVLVRIWDITGETGLPAFLALACDADGVAGVEPELGGGCHASADVALSRALAEAAQARVTRISGARDDFSPDTFEAASRAARHEAALRLLRDGAMHRFRARAGAATPEADLEAALAALARAGFGEVVSVDLTRPEVGVPVTRTIIPGLAGPWMEGDEARAA